jgi:hypothetical protein
MGSHDHSVMTIPAKMPAEKECIVCGRMFANKSNLNRHIASIHQKSNKDKEKDTKTVFARNSLSKLSKHGLHNQTLNTVLWNIVQHLIETKQLSTEHLSSGRKFS